MSFTQSHVGREAACMPNDGLRPQMVAPGRFCAFFDYTPASTNGFRSLSFRRKGVACYG